MEALTILRRINTLIFLVSITGAVVIFIWLGIKYFMAKTETEKTNKFVMYVIAGIILLIIAGTVPTLILSFLKGKI